MKECKSNLEESIATRDSFLIALQTKQTELEKYIAFNDWTVDYDKLQTKLNETLGLLAQKNIDIKEGLKLKAYEISVVKQKHDELVKQSLLTKSHFEGLLKEKSKVISDLKVKEGKDIDKMISMEKQLKILNKIGYKRNQSIQTIHMLAPKCSIYNGRPTFANPMYLKKAQAEKPCLYEIPYDNSDLANRFAPEREETITLDKESRSKLNKDLVKPYDYTKQNSLYETFKPPSQEYLDQLAHAKEVRKKMWRKSFVKTKPNIVKNIAFLPVSKSISKSRKAYNVMTNNINHFREIVDQAWVIHTYDSFSAPTALDMEEMHEDFKYVESLEKDIDELESDKADFSNMYDLLLQECVSKNVMCSYLHSLSDLDTYNELQCLYLHKVKECKYLAEKLSKQTENVNEKVYNELLRSFAKLEKHSISLELDLQICKEKLKNDTVCKENASNLNKLIEKFKGQGVDTNFEQPSILGKSPLQPFRNQPVIRQPSAYKSERSPFPKQRFASQVDVPHNLTKPVTPHSRPQIRKSSFPNPSDVNAPGPSRNSPKHVSFQSQREYVGSNDMVHNYYLEEAKKNAQPQKEVNAQLLPPTACKAVRNTNVLKP
ncbi:hypothetical protein Tco_0679948 [Tanacetum coccineum]|uniref:Uncharacterized protein n=1 Tax=Tanacetum coccineum TaxID=301880 RepID=A0ABQ4XJI0_9ASTR